MGTIGTLLEPSQELSAGLWVDAFCIGFRVTYMCADIQTHREKGRHAKVRDKST